MRDDQIRLHYHDADEVWAVPSNASRIEAPGIDGGRLRVTLNNGQTYDQLSALGYWICDATVVGEGGMELAPVALAFWRLYLVPSINDASQLVIIASPNEPNIGPTGYSCWKYLGAVCYDPLAMVPTWRQFVQQGSHMRYLEPIVNLAAAAGADANPVANNLLSAAIEIPPERVAAVEVGFSSALTIGMGTAINLTFWQDDSGGGGPPPAVPLGIANETIALQEVYGSLWVTNFRANTDDPYVWYQRIDAGAAGATATLGLAVFGFEDDWLI